MDQRSSQALSRCENEVFQARTIANQMYTEAKVEQLNSEVYQYAVVTLGQKATEMIKERDLESCCLRQTCEITESQTKQLMGTTSSIIGEARARIRQDEMCMELSGRQLVSLKTELAETIEINKQQQESIQNLRWIEDRVPDAQRRFAEIEQKVSCESLRTLSRYGHRSSWRMRRSKLSLTLRTP